MAEGDQENGGAGDDDAFDAARDALAAAPPVTAPNGTAPGGKRERNDNDRKGNRWRARNLRRKNAGKPALTEAEQIAADQEAGYGGAREPGAPSVTSQGPGEAESRFAQGVRRERQTRAELEAEVERLRAQVDGESKAAIATAIGETARVVWDIARRFTPSKDRALSDVEVEALGDAWAPVLTPHMAEIAEASPWIIAAGVTYRVLAPRVEAAITREPEPARVASGSESKREERAASPADPAPPVNPAEAPPLTAVPPGADPTKFGYSPSDGIVS